jgi:SAM-dependent methyltransferase
VRVTDQEIVKRRFIDMISPPRLRERIIELCQSDPAVTVLSYMLDPDRLLEWAHSVAVVHDEVLQACVPPIPPLELRRITAAPDAEGFLWTGLVDLAQVFALHERFGSTQAGRGPRVLDFGCGCGRMTRYLNLIEGVEGHGLDVNPDLVAWCQQNLDRVHTVLDSERPPMPLPDQSFDLVYSLSIFTHLTEDRSRQWMQDIARVMVPGGVLILTIHGYQALEIIRGSSVHQGMFGLDERSTGDLVTRLEAERFVFMPYRPEVLEIAKAGADYGNSFIDETYVSSNWNSAELDVLAHIPGGLRNWQDIVVLRRR